MATRAATPAATGSGHPKLPVSTSTLPSTAIPRAPAASTSVSFTPDADPARSGRCRRHDQLGARGGRGADADAEEQPGDRHHLQAPDAPPPPPRASAPSAVAPRPDAATRPCPYAADEPGIADGGDQRRHRRGHEEESGHHRGLAERALDPLRDHELRTEHGEEQRRHGGGAPQEARVVPGGGVDQRAVRTGFAPARTRRAGARRPKPSRPPPARASPSCGPSMTARITAVSAPHQ